MAYEGGVEADDGAAGFFIGVVPVPLRPVLLHPIGPWK